ncbi:MAG: hypothetical protein ACP5O0_04230 [Acidimicrobiales bacterium]
MGEGLASLFAAVVDLGFELVSERLDVRRGGWVHGGGFAILSEFRVAGTQCP